MKINYTSTIHGRFGNILVAETENGVCFVDFFADLQTLKQNLGYKFPKAEIIQGGTQYSDKVFALFKNEVTDILDVPLDLFGTPFQIKVWNEIRKIPRGQLISYTELARKIGSPKAVRAVANVCGRNLIGVVIPCHRVVTKGGHTSGYRWGYNIRMDLFRREGINMGFW